MSLEAFFLFVRKKAMVSKLNLHKMQSLIRMRYIFLSVVT